MFGVAAFCFFGVALGGIVLFEPLYWEFVRLRTLTIALQFISELVALFWFVPFLVRRWILRDENERGDELNLRLLFATIVIGVLLDFAMGLELRRQDWLAWIGKVCRSRPT